AYLKRYHPAEFYCALLNAQPMGFYTPMTIAGDARRHGVRFLAADVNHSAWECRVEGGAVRLGLSVVRGVGEAEREGLERALARGPFATAAAFAEVARDEGASARVLEALAAAGALGGTPREALWEVLAAVRAPDGPLGAGTEHPEPPARLAPFGPMEALAHELLATGLWVEGHPFELMRRRLSRRGIVRVEEVGRAPNGAVLDVAGIVICRQR